MSNNGRQMTIGGITFDRVRYDSDADILIAPAFLSSGQVEGLLACRRWITRPSDT